MQYAQAKAAGEVQDYTIDWSKELESGETITSSTWIVDSGLTEGSSTNTTTTTTIFLSGGTGGEKYKVTNTIETSNTNPRTYKKTLIIPVIKE